MFKFVIPQIRRPSNAWKQYDHQYMNFMSLLQTFQVCICETPQFINI